MALGLTPTTLSFIAGNGTPAPSAGVTDVLQNGVSVVDNGVARVTVPTNTSDLQNDSGFITSSDIPAIPTKTSELQNDSGFVTSSAIPTKTSDLQNDSGFVTAGDIRQLPASTSADSGEVLTVDSQGNPGWAQLPPPVVGGVQDVTVDGVSVVTQGVAEITMPSVNDGTLTIKQNGITKGGFSANSSIDRTVNIEVPTSTSDLTNDMGFITASQVPNVYDGKLTIMQNGEPVGLFSANSSGDSTALITVPTKTSELQNDSGFITSSDIPAIPTKTSDLQNDSGFITSSSLPTVDQTYNASSANAQSGVAVAQAIAGITPGGSGSLNYYLHIPNTESETVVSNITPVHSATTYTTGLMYEMPAASANDVLVGGSGYYVGASGIIRVAFNGGMPTDGWNVAKFHLFVNDPRYTGYTAFHSISYANTGKPSWETSTISAPFFEVPYMMSRQELRYSSPVEIYVFFEDASGNFFVPTYKPYIIFYKFA